MDTLEALQKDHAEKCGFLEGSESFDAHKEGFKFAVFLVNQILSDTLAADGPVACMEATVNFYQELLFWKESVEEADHVH